jgi:hypothetical protein
MGVASTRTRGAVRTDEWLLFGAVATVGALPLVPLAAVAGGDGLTGANGLFPADQLQYLAWITSMAEHGLAASNFDLGSHRHVYIGPVFFVSSLLVRAGASPQLAYLLWLPIATGALVMAYRSFVASSLSDRFDRACALCLALFAFTPLLPIGDWVGLIGGDVARDFGLVATDTSPVLALWGAFPVALVLALCVVVLVAAERILAAKRPSPATLGLCAGTALLASWTHPWQGIVLIVTLAGLALAEGRRRQVLWLAVPAVAAGLPLVYFHLLPTLDSAWETARLGTSLISGFDRAVTLAAVAPLTLAALPALLRRPSTQRGKTLRIWVVATFATWAVDPPYEIHALETLTLPLAILAAEGWRGLQVRKPVLLGFVALMIVPGAIWATKVLEVQVREHRGAYLLRPADRAALDYVRSSAPPGGVLAPFEISMAVPAFTDRPTWIGHPVWTPWFFYRVTQGERLFAGRSSDAGAVRFVRHLKPRIVLAPCGTSPRLSRQLEQIVERSRRFGCAAVYVLALGRS